MAEAPPRIGDLKSAVTLAKEVQSTNAQNSISFSFINQTNVYAHIEAVSQLILYNELQTEIGKITHKITMRWRDDFDMFEVVIRERIRQTDQTTRIEVYRIHSKEEYMGQQRFIFCDCELLEDIN